MLGHKRIRLLPDSGTSQIAVRIEFATGMFPKQSNSSLQNLYVDGQSTSRNPVFPQKLPSIMSGLDYEDVPLNARCIK
jgi:hypothetical protein